ncbi:methyltransferase domain-containing protein [Pedobacter sp. G11]|uniref:class I SAM-dependent methyltransferase n=1 Tax=Pedobacter sp. G11 TaxID=2482728 RepID=UPI000F5F3A34|nr:methyltransferase domain-containing protein [Pedobacter sp. G11]AZI24326.1 methyltransferase domain-containing protein [Pedobacter sp. G11]
MINNYDKIANYYDSLSRLVFGKSQLNAQINQLKNITKNSSILIVGGGTGWILEEIGKRHPSGLKITYVEISAKMLKLSKDRDYGANSVLFIHSSIEDFNLEDHFNIILTPFLFDNFAQERCHLVFQKLDVRLNKDGLWFLVDFTTQPKSGKWWKKLFLKVMYKFFGLISDVEASNLVDMSPYFNDAGYKIIEERSYYGQFIKALIYQK